MARERSRPAFEECPHCGSPFRAGRPACPECGSDAETGWRDAEDVDYLSVEIPDTYEEFTGDATRRGAPRTAVMIAVLILVAALILSFVLPFV